MDADSISPRLQDPLVLLTHALDKTLGYVPTAHSDSSTCSSLPNDSGGPGATLRYGGHRNPFCK